MTLSIGLTLGDPTGIGPELWVRMLCDGHVAGPDDGQLALRLYGDAGVLERAAALGGKTTEWQALRQRLGDRLRIYPVTTLSTDDARPGQPGPASGAAQVAYLEAAVAAAVAGELQGVCTAPLHKASAIAAGLDFPGHTELLGARLGRGGPAVMMLAGPSLRVALATTHLPLSAVAASLSVEGLSDVICCTATALHDDFGIARPRLWVAGLNPHAGEAGHFGDEESRLIAPAMAMARDRLAKVGLPQLELAGPLVPDALFRAAVHGPPDQRPDAVIAMYHDQGLIPLKLLDFDRAVNVTLGLRIVRTSPDHGVAHDIAGRWLARPDSQAAALDLCIDLCRRRQTRATAWAGPR